MRVLQRGSIKMEVAATRCDAGNPKLDHGGVANGERLWHMPREWRQEWLRLEVLHTNVFMAFACGNLWGTTTSFPHGRVWVRGIIPTQHPHGTPS